jgi:hypothetical protein
LKILKKDGIRRDSKSEEQLNAATEKKNRKSLRRFLDVSVRQPFSHSQNAAGSNRGNAQRDSQRPQYQKGKLLSGDFMSIITARDTFTETVLTRKASCNACHHTHYAGATVLSKPYTNPNNRAQTAHVVLCNDDCWQTFDHNFWASRPLRKAHKKFQRELQKYEFKTDTRNGWIKEMDDLDRQICGEIEAETARLTI